MIHPSKSAVAFQFTDEMHQWIYATHFDGPCMAYDRWTYGLTLIVPTAGEFTPTAPGRGNYAYLDYCKEVA